MIEPFYERGGITIYKGDAVRTLRALLRAPEFQAFDLILTDPPYNVSARGIGGRANTTVGRVPRKDGTSREIVRDFGEWDHGWNPRPFVRLTPQLLRDGGSLVAFTSEFTLAPYLRSALDHRAMLYWRKTNPAPNFRQQVVRAVECAVWQTKGGGWRFNEGGYRPNVWEGPVLNGFTCENTSEKRIHPNQKPEWLMRAWIQLFTNPGDLILDAYGGSMTTLRAAKDLGRRAIAIELDEEMCDKGARRMEQEVLL